MSLVAAVDERKEGKSSSSDVAGKNYNVTGTRSRGSSTSSHAYQTNGVPLSKEALYRARMKYGVYTTPAASVRSPIDRDANGASKFSNSAALLAATKKQNPVEAYERVVDPNAHVAARQFGEAVNKTANVHPVAKVKKAGQESKNGSRNAATKAYSITSVKSQNSVQTGSTNQTYSLASAKSVISNAAAPKPVVQAAPKKSMLDYSKIMRGAEKQADSRLQQRMAPEKMSYVRGLSTKSSKNDGKSMEFSHLPTTPSQTYSISSNYSVYSDKYASDAANAVKNFDLNSMGTVQPDQKQLEMDRKNQILAAEKIMSIARANTSKRLESIDSDVNSRKLFSNEEYNKKAIIAAQQNLKYLSPPAKDKNAIDLGGGLVLSTAEVNEIAKKMVTPVLTEVSTRAQDQRDTDADIKRRVNAYNKGMNHMITFHRQKVANNSALIQKTSTKHRNEKKALKEEKAIVLNTLVSTMESIVVVKNNELSEAQAEFDLLKKQMEIKVKSYELKQETETQHWQENRDNDIEKAKKEQLAIIKPYKEDLKAAELEHKSLLLERDEIQEHIEELKESIEEHRNKIITLEDDLKEQEAKQEEEHEKFYQLNKDKSNLQDLVDNSLLTKANKVKEEALLSSKQANLRQLEVEAMINERKSELNNVELELKREKLKLIETLGESAKLRNEKIDDTKLEPVLNELTAKGGNSTVSNEATVKTAVTSVSDVPSASARSVTGASGVISDDRHKIVTEPVAVTATSPLAKEIGAHDSDNIDTHKTQEVDHDELNEIESNEIHDDGPSMAQTKTVDELKNKAADEVKSTFSGFSQGTLPEEPNTNKDNSYFKEVFPK